MAVLFKCRSIWGFYLRADNIKAANGRMYGNFSSNIKNEQKIRQWDTECYNQVGHLCRSFWMSRNLRSFVLVRHFVALQMQLPRSCALPPQNIMLSVQCLNPLRTESILRKLQNVMKLARKWEDFANIGTTWKTIRRPFQQLPML
jgi:hypothetical protein